MSTYRNLRGYNNQDIKKVVPYQTFPASVVNTGQIWYGADNNFYIQKQTATVNSWSIANNPPVTSPSASFGAGGCGTQTAALGYGKILSPAPTFNPTAAAILAESYDGTNWSAISNLDTVRTGSASSTAGSQTATVVFGGFLSNPPAPPSAIRSNTISKWNGTAWSAGNVMPFARSGLGGSGTSTAALAFGGIQNPPAPAPTRPTQTAAKYDGTNWTNVNSMQPNPSGFPSTGFVGIAACGTQTATFAWSSDPIANFQTYDGTNWATSTVLSSTRIRGGVSGTQTASIAFGGTPSGAFVQGPSNASRLTESWNGTSWTTLLSRNTAVTSCPGVGSQTSALNMGSNFSPLNSNTNVIEEWDTNLFSSQITAT